MAQDSNNEDIDLASWLEDDDVNNENTEWTEKNKMNDETTQNSNENENENENENDNDNNIENDNNEEMDGLLFGGLDDGNFNFLNEEDIKDMANDDNDNGKDNGKDKDKSESNKNENNKNKNGKHGISFKSLSSKQLLKGERSYRCIQVPGARMIHVRRLWKEICDPIVTQLKLQIRMNSKKNLIEIRTSAHTKLSNAIQKGADFLRATAVLGFEIKDAIALIRMDDIYLESFDIRDVKFFNKKSDHWMRAVGRIAGQYGKIKYSIENSTNSRIVIFGFKVHILGSFTSIRLARNAISRLVMGSAPGNVYANLRTVSNRMKNRF